MVTCGAGLVTITVCCAVAVLREVPVTVQVMTVAPTGYKAVRAFPSLRFPTTDAMPQLSEVTGVPGLSDAPHEPAALSTIVMLAGQVMLGGVLSVTSKKTSTEVALPQA